jgi:flagellar biosynthesis protein FlhG
MNPVSSTSKPQQGSKISSISNMRLESTRSNRGVLVVALVSGKGGVGKTNIAANLSVMLSRMSRQVLLIDADLGLANVDIIMGLTTRRTLYDVVCGSASLADTIIEGPGGVWILPATSGIYEMTCLTEQQRFSVLHQIDVLDDRFDTVMIDNAAGISHDVQFFTGVANQVLVVTDKEPTAITNAYATIKILCQRGANRCFHLLVNNVENDDEAHDVYRRLTRITDRFLNASVSLFGAVPHDENINRAVMARRLLVDLFPNSPATERFHSLATKLLSLPLSVGDEGGMKMFWERLFRHNNSGNRGDLT